MTPERAFRSGGRNPDTGLWVKDWYVMGCVFSALPVLHGGKILVGFRTLVCTDAASLFLMHREPIPAAPEPLRAERVISFFGAVFASHGRPRVGIVVSHSAWLSSTELAVDPDTSPQGEFLSAQGICFGPMAREDSDAIRGWSLSRGFACEFDADNIRAVDP